MIMFFFINTSGYTSPDATMLPSGWVVSFVGCCLLAIFAGCFIFLYFRFIDKLKFQASDFVLFLFLPTGQSLCCFLLVRIYQSEQLQIFYQKPAWIFGALIEVLGTIAILYFISERARQEEINRKYRERIYLWDIERTHYAALEERSHELEKIRHDLNNQINAIMQLISEKDYGKAETAADELKEKVQRAAGGEKEYCANSVVNAVMTEKAKECRKYGITLKTDLRIGEMQHISLLHQCSLFSNLMDNAIHAASVFSGERYISVYASVQGVYLTVRVTNSSDNPAKKSPGRKGCGIEIIKDIVEEYQGHYSGKWENNEYKTIVSVADCLRKPGTEKLLHASEDRGTNLRP